MNTKVLRLAMRRVEGGDPPRDLPEVLQITRRVDMANYQEHKKKAHCLMLARYDPADEPVFAELAEYFNTR